MARLQQISQWLFPSRLSEMAERVAGRSRMMVWQRVASRLNNLGPTEARGYIRSRAATIVIAETDRLIEQEGEKVARMREQIIDTSLAMLVDVIAAQMRERAVATMRQAA